MNNSKMECNLTIGDKFVFIKPSADGTGCVVQMDGQFTDEEVAAVNIISRTIACLRDDTMLGPYFNPTLNEVDDSRLMKVEWLRSGKLVLRTVAPGKRFRHAYTVEEAMQRDRVFTCERRLYRVLPKRRRKDE